MPTATETARERLTLINQANDARVPLEEVNDDIAALEQVAALRVRADLLALSANVVRSAQNLGVSFGAVVEQVATVGDDDPIGELDLYVSGPTISMGQVTRGIVAIDQPSRWQRDVRRGDVDHARAQATALLADLRAEQAACQADADAHPMPQITDLDVAYAFVIGYGHNFRSAHRRVSCQRDGVRLTCPVCEGSGHGRWEWQDCEFCDKAILRRTGTVYLYRRELKAGETTIAVRDSRAHRRQQRILIADRLPAHLAGDAEAVRIYAQEAGVPVATVSAAQIADLERGPAFPAFAEA